MENNTAEKVSHGIARKLIIYILCFSSIITLTLTCLQLYFDYSRDVRLIEKRMHEIRSSHLETIINDVWVSNERLLKIQLEGIMQLPDIRYLEIQFDDGRILSLGELHTKRIIQYEFPLSYTYRNKNVYLGNLLIVAGLDDVYQRLIDKALVIFVSNAVKTFLVSVFIFFIFYYFVGRHLSSMASFTLSLNLETIGEKLSLKRKTSPKNLDELDTLVNSINQMRSNLAAEIKERDEAEATVQALFKSMVGTTGQDCFDQVTVELCDWLNADCSIVGVLQEDGMIRAVAMNLDGEKIENFVCRLQGSPCEKVIDKGFYFCQKNVRNLFPGNEYLLNLDAEGYVGVLLHGKNGNILGILNVISRSTMQIPKRIQDALDIIAAKVASEIERKQSAMALLKSEQRFRAIFEQTAIGVAQIEVKTGRFVTINQKYCDIVGYSRKEMQAKTFQEITHQDDVQADLNDKAKLVKGELYEFHKEKRYISKDGSVVWVNLTRSPLWKNGEDPLYYLAIVEDISDQKRAEAKNINLEARLNQAQKMEAIGTLAGGIAHDFNNILGLILGYTGMAREDSPADSLVAKYLDMVLKSGYRAKELVKQILAFSRQDSGDRIPLQPASLLLESIKMLRASIPTTIEINKNIDPQCGVILADPTQFDQIMMNLCTNAFHVMEETGGTLSISLQGMELSSDDFSDEEEITTGKYVELTVRDSGPGINPEVIDRIFDPYFTTKEVGKGTGMGLAIVHGIIKSYGGAITVENNPGVGSAFHVFFPVITSEIDSGEGPAAATYRGNERILFVDDEEMMTDMSKDILERLGYRVTTKENSLMALETFQEHPARFDLVITDQTMPGLTGVDLAQRMLQIRPDIPIILCTGYSTVISEEKAKSLGFKGFVMKPVGKEKLAKLVRKVLDGIRGD